MMKLKSNCTVEKANVFIKENQNAVNMKYRQNYHLMPPIGWMNDPNGFSYNKNRYHLFYQYYPYKAKWNSMHWGHATTTDFISWKTEEVALSPDQSYDSFGCFSGTAMDFEGKLYLMYTAVQMKGIGFKQQQALAVSDDGIHFEKFKNNPVIPTSALPENISPNDFRDPRIWRKNDRFYSAIAAKDKKIGGRMLLFEAIDLEHWKYKCDLIQPDKEFGAMWECPDIFELEGKYAVLMSAINLPRKGYDYWNKNSSVYALGSIDNTGESLSDYQFHEIDYGFDFYAPQTVKASDGRRIMTAWMQAWEDSIPTQKLKHGWAGTMILPRELSIEGGLLIQKPVHEIENYRADQVSYENVAIDEKELCLDKVNGKSIELELEADLKGAEAFTVNLFQSKEYKTVVSYDKNKEELTFDRSNSGIRIKHKKFDKPDYRTLSLKLEDDDRLHLRIFIDVSSAEIFAQQGAKVITSRVYPLSGDYGVSFAAKGKVNINQLNKWILDLRKD